MNNQLLASDNFVSGSLAAGWSPLPGLAKAQVVVGSPNVTEPNVVGTGAGQIWTGITWPNDQISEVTIQNLSNANASNTVGLAVRFNSVVQSGYLAILNGLSGNLIVFKDVAGSVTQLGSTVTGLTFAAGDVVSFQAAGAGLTVYKNGQRIYFLYDTTFTSGSPGFDQNSGVSVSASQVSAWRGYSAVQQDGIWQKQGITIAPVVGDLSNTTPGVGIQCWNIFQDTNAQILSGTVFKTWIVSDWSNDVQSSMFYAESTDGINWTRRPTAVLAGVTNGSVFKVGSTYYMYGQASGASGSGNMLVYTSSDGISWAQQTPSQVLSKGTGGQWDAGSFYNIISVAIVGGTWYGFYNAANGGPFSTGLATSTDGINWTKFGSSPVIQSALTGSALANVGGTWYMWCTANQPGQGGTSLDPFEMVRYSSTNLTTWTFSAHSMHMSQLYESVNALTGGLTCGAILDVGGKAYQYTNSSQGDSSAPQVGQIGLAIAPVSISSVVLFGEDAAQQIAADGFTSGIGDLSSNWVTPTGSTKLQIVAGNSCEGTVLATSCFMAYAGASFSPNHYSEVVLKTLSDSGQFISPAVRMQIGAKSWYAINLQGPVGTLNASLSIARQVAGVSTQLGPAHNITPQIGDVYRISVFNGSDGFPVLSVFQNGFLILQATDYGSSALSTGFPGMGIFASTSLANAQLSSWAGGNANVIPAYPSAAIPPLELHLTYTAGGTLSIINNPDDPLGNNSIVVANQNTPTTVSAAQGLPQPGKFGTLHGRYDQFTVINNPA
jgi:hypothetical protein